MKKHFHLFLCFVCAGIGLISCQKAPELTITSPASIELSAEGSSGSITFTANRDWRVSSSDSWVTVSPSSGAASDGTVTVTVRCNANTTYDDRTATVSISMEELSQSVTVRQLANKGVVLPKQAFDLQADATSIDIEVQANVQYAVTTSVDWIKQTGTKGLSSKTLTFSIEENKTYDSREGKITIKPQDGSVQEQVISVKQAQKDALNVEKTSYDMPYGGGEIEIKVEANVSFDVMPNADWINYTQTKALSSSTVCLKIDENATYSSRQGTVEIKQQNGSLKHTITVNQAGRIAVTSIELSKTNLTLFVGEEETLVATVKPENATDKNVTWSSSSESIAFVDQNGKVSAKKKGAVTITVTAGNISATCSVEVIFEIEAIDLGLSVKWANANLGASAQEDPGDYFAWGEIETHYSCLDPLTWKAGKEGGYVNASYKWWQENDDSGYIFSKYYVWFANDTVLKPEDDVVVVALGDNWHMPTGGQIRELVDECDWEWITVNGTKCRKVTGPNGNSILLPSTGLMRGTELANTDNGFYWSANYYAFDPNFAICLDLELLNSEISKSFRPFGLVIRPVK